MTHAEPARPRAGKIVLYVLAAAALLLVVLLVLLLLLVRSDHFETVVRQQVLPRVSERLGREVTVEGVDARVLPRPAVELRGLRMASLGGPPILASETTTARLRIWPLLTSRGRHLVLDSLRFADTEVNLIRRPGGAWDLPRPAPPEEKRLVDLERVVLDRGSIYVRMTPNAEPSFEVADLRAAASYVAGTLSFRDLRADVYGADLRGDGSKIELGQPALPWVLALALDGLTLGDLPTATDPFQGTLGFAADAEGSGVAPQQLASTANGSGTLQGEDLVWTSLDLEGLLWRELAGWFGRVGIPTEAPPQRGPTTLGDLRTRFTVRDGWIQLDRPIQFPSPAGETTVGGRVRLDLDLDLEAKTQVKPDLIAALTRGELRPDEPVPLAYRIRGTFRRPTLAQVDPSALLPLIGDEATDRLKREIERGLEKVLPPLGTTPAPPSGPP